MASSLTDGLQKPPTCNPVESAPPTELVFKTVANQSSHVSDQLPFAPARQGAPGETSRSLACRGPPRASGPRRKEPDSSSSPAGNALLGNFGAWGRGSGPPDRCLRHCRHGTPRSTGRRVAGRSAPSPRLGLSRRNPSCRSRNPGAACRPGPGDRRRGCRLPRLATSRTVDENQTKHGPDSGAALDLERVAACAVGEQFPWQPAAASRLGVNKTRGHGSGPRSYSKARSAGLAVQAGPAWLERSGSNRLFPLANPLYSP